MGWESSGVVRFDLGPIGQTSIAKLKSAYNSLPRGLDGIPPYRKPWAVNLLVKQA